MKKLEIEELHVYMDDFFRWDYIDNCLKDHGYLCGSTHGGRSNSSSYGISLAVLMTTRNRNTASHSKSLDFGLTAALEASHSHLNLSDILAKIDSFIGSKDHQKPLHEWLKLAGHLNWLLNVLPWGRPALSELYRKTAGKLHNHAMIYLNAMVIDNLMWLTRTIPASIGILLWMLDNGIRRMLISSCGPMLVEDMGYARNGFVYQLHSPERGAPPVDIFFLELLAILSGIHHVAHFQHPPQKLLIYTDSLDAVVVLGSLRASKQLHNAVLLAIAGIMMKTGMDLHVHHIEGKLNTRADMLS